MADEKEFNQNAETVKYVLVPEDDNDKQILDGPFSDGNYPAPEGQKLITLQDARDHDYPTDNL